MPSSLDKFEEYEVIISSIDDSDEDPVVLFVWAQNLHAAMNCGEVLTAIYLCGE